MITMYGIKNCDTIKKARRWLDENNISYQFHDVRSDGLEKSQLEHWLTSNDWETVLNRRSTSWRNLSDVDKADIDQDKAIELMMEHPTLIKRPVLDTGTLCEIGFKAARYETLFQSS